MTHSGIEAAGHAGDVDSSRGDLDEEQDVQSLQQHGLYREEVARQHSPALSDEEPAGDWLNDTTRLVIEGLAPYAPRAAGELALNMAERADARVAELPLGRMAPRDPASPIHPIRAEHRNEHLDEIAAALERRG